MRIESRKRVILAQFIGSAVFGAKKRSKPFHLFPSLKGNLQFLPMPTRIAEEIGDCRFCSRRKMERLTLFLRCAQNERLTFPIVHWQRSEDPRPRGLRSAANEHG